MVTTTDMRVRNEGAQRLATSVFRDVCTHIDGLAVGSTVAALAARGAAEEIATGGRTAGDLRHRFDANPGYLGVALRLLADQGWVTCEGEFGSDELTIAPTRTGVAALTSLADGYRLAAKFLPLGEQLDAVLSGHDAPGLRSLEHAAELVVREWRLPPDTLPVYARHQVLAHLNGHILAPLMSCLARHGVPYPGSFLPPGSDPAALHVVGRILASQGWGTIDGDEFRPTPAGRTAAAYARQYWHTVSYLPLLRQVPELLFGDPRPIWTPLAAAPGEERHLDRELDIRFSGDVFTAVCREPFFDVVLPVFDWQPLRHQPVAVVDAGCGDGTLLAALYTEVRDKTMRGENLAEFPLIMVGAEPSPVARRVASEQLTAAGIPHLMIDGDIAAPDAIAKALRRHGIDAADALHVSKSVIHDRDYRPPTAASTASTPGLGRPPKSSGAFAAPDGAAITPAAMALSLAELFSNWRGLARKHGLVVVEAHSAAPAVTAGLLGRGVATSFDATHGYSNQYPVEYEVFSWAARAAGFRTHAHREPVIGDMGYTVLSVDHFR